MSLLEPELELVAQTQAEPSPGKAQKGSYNFIWT